MLGGQQSVARSSEAGVWSGRVGCLSPRHCCVCSHLALVLPDREPYSSGPRACLQGLSGCVALLPHHTLPQGAEGKLRRGSMMSTWNSWAGGSPSSVCSAAGPWSCAGVESNTVGLTHSLKAHLPCVLQPYLQLFQPDFCA